jgi:hypothetical protein
MWKYITSHWFRIIVPLWLLLMLTISIQRGDTLREGMHIWLDIFIPFVLAWCLYDEVNI